MRSMKSGKKLDQMRPEWVETSQSFALMRPGGAETESRILFDEARQGSGGA